MSELEILQRRIARERAARKEAESLLEQKSRELYETNQQLRKLVDQNRAIVDTAAEGIITYDQTGAIQAFNRSAERIFRCESLVGTSIYQLFEHDSKIKVTLFPNSGPLLGDDEEITEPLELVGIRPNGSTFVLEIATSVISEGDSKLYTALLRDLSRRKKLEARLNHVQKMESIGQLAAGIAHEINTPIQFVGNNIEFLQSAFGEIEALLDLYCELAFTLSAGRDTSQLLKSINERCELADLSFLREEAPGAITQSIEGIERVATIVRAMKEFSQPATGVKTPVDINRAIENTVAISVNSYRDVTAVELQLEPSLGLVPCLSAEMNQAILNVLANAAEAIADSKTCGAGRIRVVTRTINDEVEIRIEDNGPGIPQEIEARIFDPFFTTKEVGKGTGQGLAFVYDLVVNKHGGSIYAEAGSQGGTVFVIRLPQGSEIQHERREYADSVS